MDDQRVLSGIVYVIRNGLQWKDAPKAHGPHKTLYNRFILWSRLGVFDRIFVALTEQAGCSKCLMINATHLKAHRTSAFVLLIDLPDETEEVIGDSELPRVLWRQQDPGQFRPGNQSHLTIGICIKKNLIENMFAKLKDW